MSPCLCGWQPRPLHLLFCEPLIPGVFTLSQGPLLPTSQSALLCWTPPWLPPPAASPDHLLCPHPISGPYPESAPSAWDVCLACSGSLQMVAQVPSALMTLRAPHPHPHTPGVLHPTVSSIRLQTTLPLRPVCWASSERAPWQGSCLSCSPGALRPSTVLLAPGTCSINLC